MNLNSSTIMQKMPEVSRYLESLSAVQFAYLFGSLAKGRITPMSDADFAVYLNENSNFPEAKLDILGGLMDILEIDEIDLVILNTAPLPLAMNILKNKQILVDRHPHARHLYESLTMRKFFDFSVLENDIFERRYGRG